MESWYVVQTRSRFEKRSYDLLVRAGITAYLPLQNKISVWSDRLKKIQVPLFSGYLFVKMSEANRYAILNTPGIVKFLSFAGKYAQVPDLQIAAIKRALAADETMDIVDWVDYVTGQEVKIISGPFSDCFAKVIRGVNGKGRLLLEIEALNKAIVLEIGKTRVEPLTELVTA